MNKLAVLVVFVALVAAVGCAMILFMNDDQDKGSKHSDTDAGGVLTLTVDGKVLEVEWEESSTVRTLKALARGVIDVRA